jgi:hypothetical protein
VKILPIAREHDARLLAGRILRVPREATNRNVNTNVTLSDDGEKRIGFVARATSNVQLMQYSVQFKFGTVSTAAEKP